MYQPFRTRRRTASFVLVVGATSLGFLLALTRADSSSRTEPAKPAGGDAVKPQGVWRVDDVRPGMKGYGLTVMKGTKVERFDAEVIGVLKNTSPGRDMILCRLAGLDLERTGIIAGMSGSPVYIDGKLLGAVAYGWAYGKDPIGGITPFSQMQDYVASFESRDLTEKNKGRRAGTRHTLPTPLTLGEKTFDSVTVSQNALADDDTHGEGLWLRPLQTPVVASGMSANSLKLLRQETRDLGLVPLQGGAASAPVQDAAKDAKLEAGGPLTVALIRGDFDLSGVGTVTHIEGDRVYGFGHPFMSLGACEFPLMTGWIHTIYPRQSVSFKMGTPLKTVGVINADVSTCIAGWLGRTPDMLPMKMTVSVSSDGEAKTFNVELARQKSLVSSLVFTALANSIDMEGELPEEMTARFTARIELEGYDPLVIEDTFSGFAGGRAPGALYSQMGSVVNLLTNNAYKPIRIKRIDCTTHIEAGRRSADIEAVELESEVYSPGETVKANVFVRPFKGELKKLAATLRLPLELPEGEYTASVGDDLSAARGELRDRPALGSPADIDQVVAGIRKLMESKRTNLTVRLPLGTTGVSVEGKELDGLPESMVKILGGARKSGALTIRNALVERHATEWVIQGSESVTFKVTKNKKVTTP